MKTSLGTTWEAALPGSIHTSPLIPPKNILSTLISNVWWLKDITQHCNKPKHPRTCGRLVLGNYDIAHLL